MALLRKLSCPSRLVRRQNKNKEEDDDSNDNNNNNVRGKKHVRFAPIFTRGITCFDLRNSNDTKTKTTDRAAPTTTTTTTSIGGGRPTPIPRKPLPDYIRAELWHDPTQLEFQFEADVEQIRIYYNETMTTTTTCTSGGSFETVVAELEAQAQDEICSRGLEQALNPHRREQTHRYMTLVVLKSRALRRRATTTIDKKKKKSCKVAAAVAAVDDELQQYASTLSTMAREVALGDAAYDEQEAQSIYLESCGGGNGHDDNDEEEHDHLMDRPTQTLQYQHHQHQQPVKENDIDETTSICSQSSTCSSTATTSS